MVRLLILVLIVVAGLLVGPMMVDQKGYVLIAVNEQVIETSVVVMVMVILIFYALLQMLEWGLVNTLTLWGRTRNWFGWRRQRVAREKTLSSVLDLAQGNYLTAEKNSVRNAQLSDKPLLNYLTAAQAAQQQGKNEQRDRYLQRADELNDGQLAVQTTRLKLHLEANEYEDALAWLIVQNEKTLNEKPILQYAYRVYLKLERWDLLLPLLDNIQKNKLIDSEQYHQLFERCHRSLLVAAADNGIDELNRYYQGLSRKLRNDIDVFTDYAELSIELGGIGEIEKELFKRLRKNMHVPLLMTLNGVSDSQVEAILEDVGQLTRQYPSQVEPFEVAGSLCMKAHLWGKAKEWFTAAIAITPSREAYQCLALTQYQLGEKDGALTNYQLAVEQVD